MAAVSIDKIIKRLPKHRRDEVLARVRYLIEVETQAAKLDRAMQKLSLKQEDIK